MPIPGLTPYGVPDIDIESPLYHESDDKYHDLFDIDIEEEDDKLANQALEPEASSRPKRSIQTKVNYKDLYRGTVVKDPLTGQL